uniref:skin secretory protein xP2-like n=1 Tax=Nyctereutes procyonoides TaxID=34880 RepID=UPI002443A46A|nr:skin secretory protein xP2-like [Nyctereutes procyonoides]
MLAAVENTPVKATAKHRCGLPGRQTPTATVASVGAVGGCCPARSLLGEAVSSGSSKLPCTTERPLSPALGLSARLEPAPGSPEPDAAAAVARVLSRTADPRAATAAPPRGPTAEGRAPRCPERAREGRAGPEAEAEEEAARAGRGAVRAERCRRAPQALPAAGRELFPAAPQEGDAGLTRPPSGPACDRAAGGVCGARPSQQGAPGPPHAR